MGRFDTLGECINEFMGNTDEECRGGNGHFVFDPNNNGWCSCCTTSDAATNTIQTASPECKIYKFRDDVLPSYVGCFKDTPNKSGKAISSTDKHNSLE